MVRVEVGNEVGTGAMRGYREEAPPDRRRWHGRKLNWRCDQTR